jgi:hypothetical protein
MMEGENTIFMARSSGLQWLHSGMGFYVEKKRQFCNTFVIFPNTEGAFERLLSLSNRLMIGFDRLFKVYS